MLEWKTEEIKKLKLKEKWEHIRKNFKVLEDPSRKDMILQKEFQKEKKLS